MAERVAVDRDHVHPKGVRVRRSTVMMHGCEPNCPALIFVVFSFETVERCINVSEVPGPIALSKEEHWYMHTLSTVLHMCGHVGPSTVCPPLQDK